MEILCSRDNAFVFIYIIVVATERRLVINVELGLFIMEWPVIFKKKKRSIWDISLASNLISWQSTRGVMSAHVLLMRTLSACLSQPVLTSVLQVTVILPRIDFTQHIMVSCPTSSHLIEQCHTLHLTWALHLAHALIPWHDLRRSTSTWAWFIGGTPSLTVSEEPVRIGTSRPTLPPIWRPKQGIWHSFLGVTTARCTTVFR